MSRQAALISDDIPVGRAPWLPRALVPVVARGFRRRLARFSDGRLEVVDGEQRDRFGDRSSDLEATLFVDRKAFYPAVALGGALGAAEGYVRGEWHTDDLVALIRIFARNQDTFTPGERRLANALRPFKRLYHRLRHNSLVGSRRNIAAHYDLGDEFYRLFLDPTMTYSSGVFPRPGASLEEASREKLDRICRKLALGPEDHVLEIGTGWGSFALHAAATYGCRVTTTTISERQFRFARRRIEERGLTDRVTVLQSDYRRLEGPFDKLVAIEMIEAVGHRYLPTFLAACERLIVPHGLVALQAITIADEHYERYRRTVDFIQRYVFPGSCLISLRHFRASLARATGLREVDCEDITPHYVRTLATWRENFVARREEVRALGFDDAFIRLWEYYLAYCEAGFAEARIGDVQIVLAGRDHPATPLNLSPPAAGETRSVTR